MLQMAGALELHGEMQECQTTQRGEEETMKGSKKNKKADARVLVCVC